jgi:hypothetical protein
MLRFPITAAVILLLGQAVTAQNVKIDEQPVITQMLEHFTNVNKSKEFVEGWRVQILATTDRQKLENARSAFTYRYPSISSNWEHSKPYYKLRAGAFNSKLETLRLLHLLKSEYPGAYLVKDNKISPEELIDADY